jgi:hypothetical protein
VSIPKLITISIISCVAAMWPTPAPALTVHGRLTTSFYAWERVPNDSTEAQYLRAHQLGIFHLEGIADPRFSVHTYVRAHGDFSEDLNDLADYRIFNLYGQWKDRARNYELRGGRMRVYAGVGNVAIDGGSASYKIRDLATLEGYVGVQVPLAGDADISSWDDRAYGGRLTFEQPREVRLALSFARRSREPLPYEEPGIYTGRQLELPAEQEELYGADFSWRFRPGASLYNRIEVDATQRRLKWGSGVLTLAPAAAPWTLDLEFVHRAPSIYGNSLLSVFDGGDYDEVSGRGGYWVTPKVRVFGNAAATFFDDDGSQRLAAGVERGRLSASYYRRMNFGGDMDGVTGAYHHPLRDWITLHVEGGVSSFKFVEDQEDRNVSGLMALGAEFRARRNLSFDVELQNLAQDIHTQTAFAGNTHDLRGHLRINYWFFTGRQVEGVF